MVCPFADTLTVVIAMTGHPVLLKKDGCCEKKSDVANLNKAKFNLISSRHGCERLIVN